MPTDPTIALGILKCRDLVQLYYGARMVANIFENNFDVLPNPTQILKADPRRIKYEIIVAGQNNAGFNFALGSQATFDTFFYQQYAGQPTSTIIIERNFFTDFDSVCLELWAQQFDVNAFISVRETFLTPSPVDEGP
jgi:hypothetical protein